MIAWPIAQFPSPVTHRSAIYIQYIFICLISNEGLSPLTHSKVLSTYFCGGISEDIVILKKMIFIAKIPALDDNKKIRGVMLCL